MTFKNGLISAQSDFAASSYANSKPSFNDFQTKTLFLADPAGAQIAVTPLERFSSQAGDEATRYGVVIGRPEQLAQLGSADVFDTLSAARREAEARNRAMCDNLPRGAAGGVWTRSDIILPPKAEDSAIRISAGSANINKALRIH